MATGHLVWESLEAAKELEKQNIDAEVINIHTIKPLDNEIILQSVKNRMFSKCWRHNYLGGLGESISRIIVKNHPCPMEFIATEDTFGESGTPSQLMKKYGLDKEAIIRKY